jgi:hypothetical protein
MLIMTYCIVLCGLWIINYDHDELGSRGHLVIGLQQLAYDVRVSVLSKVC